MNQPHPSICLQIPTINDSPLHFDKLFELWSKAKACSSGVIFDFSTCNFLRPNAVAFWGGLARSIESRDQRVMFDWNTVNDKVLAILRQNGFAAAFGYTKILKGPGNSIPYREDKTQMVHATDIKDDIIDYLSHEWLGHGWVHVSQRLKNVIVGLVWEIYDNAFEHADSSIGVFSCGQFFFHMRLLKLAVVDFGVGIPANVREFFKDYHFVDQLTASQCLKWAFQRGASTKTDITTRRGIGLDLFKEFVNINHGRLEVYSQNGYALIANGKEKFNKRRSFFDGTLVNITLRCDERYYQFADEKPLEPWF